MLGNPFTDVKYDLNSRVKFAHRTALISDELYKVNSLVMFSVYFFPLYFSVYFTHIHID